MKWLNWSWYHLVYQCDLIHWDLVTPSYLCHHFYKQWRVVCSVPRYKLNQSFLRDATNNKLPLAIVVCCQLHLWEIPCILATWKCDTPTPVIPLNSWRSHPIMARFLLLWKLGYLSSKRMLNTNLTKSCLSIKSISVGNINNAGNPVNRK